MKKRFSIQLNPASVPQILGERDKLLRIVEGVVRSSVIVRGDSVHIEGPPEEERSLKRLFRDLEEMAQRQSLDEDGVNSALALAGFSREQNGESNLLVNGDVVFEAPHQSIRARSRNQAEYFRAAMDNELVFSIGPAGTGKTYLAVAIAVRFFLEGKCERIILVRPAVEAGENLGFLPGDLKEKVDPYFRPIYDALHDLLSPDKLKRYLDQNLIEIAPLAYMRGRTLSKAFVILDEAQNTTNDQLKMFLTRLGRGSRAIVTGDLTQIDLPQKQQSGLKEALRILKNIKGIGFITLDAGDVVRHTLVQEIIQAYDND